MADKPGRAAGQHPEAGAAGDVRPHRRRPRPRPLASRSEHRQQLQADRQDVGRRGIPRDVPADGRARDADWCKRVLEDLQNIAKPIPLERFPIELNRSVGDAIEAMQALAETARASRSRRSCRRESVYIEGDLFALGRVYRNLVVERHPGDRARRAGRRGGRGARRSRAGHASTTRAAASRRTGCRRSSRTSSRPSAAASASASPSRERSSNSSADASASRAKSARARRSSSTFRARARGRWRRQLASFQGKDRCSGSCCRRGRSTSTAASIVVHYFESEDGARRPAVQLRGACSTPAIASFSTTIRVTQPARRKWRGSRRPPSTAVRPRVDAAVRRRLNRRHSTRNAPSGRSGRVQLNTQNGRTAARPRSTCAEERRP